MSHLNFRTTKVHHFTSQVLQHLQYNLDPASLPIYLSFILNLIQWIESIQFNSASVSIKYLHFNPMWNTIITWTWEHCWWCIRVICNECNNCFSIFWNAVTSLPVFKLSWPGSISSLDMCLFVWQLTGSVTCYECECDVLHPPPLLCPPATVLFVTPRPWRVINTRSWESEQWAHWRPWLLRFALLSILSHCISGHNFVIIWRSL